MESDCNSPHDLVSLVEWLEDPPDLKIDFLTKRGKKAYTSCYKSDSLKYWINDPANTFAEWVNKPGRVMDNVGFGGRPDPNITFVKLYTGEFVVNDKIVQSLKNGLKDVRFTAYPTEIVRLGNLAGIMTEISSLHGQYPGYTVYKLSKSSIPKRKQKLVDEIIVELISWSPVRMELQSVVYPIMKSELVPIINKLLLEPTTDIYDWDYNEIFHILDPTPKLLAMEGHNASEIAEILQKYELIIEAPYSSIFKEKYLRWQKVDHGTLSVVTFYREEDNRLIQEDSNSTSYPELESIFPSDINIEEDKIFEEGLFIIHREADKLSDTDLLKIQARMEKLGYIQQENKKNSVN